MLARVRSCALHGLDGVIIDVEVDLANGLPSFDIVGLPDAAVREARERVRAAIRNAGFDFPLKRITVNLSPADLRKEGSHFELPMAVGILAASGQVSLQRGREHVFVGELSLSGRSRPVAGALSMALCVRAQGLPGMVLPPLHLPEAKAAGVAAIPAPGLQEVAAWLKGEAVPCGAVPVPAVPASAGVPASDLADVRGQGEIIAALLAAAAGGHNLLLLGVPGSGKTMLARCLPGILPPLTERESLEVTRIHGAAGLLRPGAGLVRRRPFRAPHPTVSTTALVGGHALRPGEVTLAHRGVLFLDEVLEFNRQALDSLRQPLEEGLVRLARARGSVSFPARFQLVAAGNPCPCGFHGDPERTCSCNPWQVHKYISRLSGPLLDRIDIHTTVRRIPFKEMRDGTGGLSSAEAREMVMAANERQARRLAGTGIACNAEMGRAEVRRFCPLDDAGVDLLRVYYRRKAATARGHDRVLALARTVADLNGSDRIDYEHLAQACRMRELDRAPFFNGNGPPLPARRGSRGSRKVAGAQ